MTWTLSAFADEASDTIDGQIQALQRAGYKYIDLRGLGEHNISELPVELAQQAKQKLDAAGITVKMFGSPLGKIDITEDFQIDLDRLEHLAKMRDVFGCNWIRIFSYYNKNGLDKDQWQRESISRLKKLAQRAKELDLVLYHENERHIFGDRCPEVLAIACEVRDGESFRLIFDFDNYNQSGDDVWDNWQQLKDLTDAFHLKDSTKDNVHVPIGQGNGQAKRIMADALARGWDGPLSLEPHVGRSPAVMATGPSGRANEAFADMPRPDSFNVVAGIATDLLKEIGAPVE